jgi:hypothetical protein
VQSSLNRRKKKRVVVVVVRLSWHAVVDCHFPPPSFCSLLSHCAQLLFGVPRRFLFHPPAAPHFPQVGGYNNRSGWWLIHPPPGAVFHSLCGWVGERMKEEEEEKPLLRCVARNLFSFPRWNEGTKVSSTRRPSFPVQSPPSQDVHFSVASHHHPTLKF